MEEPVGKISSARGLEKLHWENVCLPRSTCRSSAVSVKFPMSLHRTEKTIPDTSRSGTSVLPSEVLIPPKFTLGHQSIYQALFQSLGEGLPSGVWAAPLSIICPWKALPTRDQGFPAATQMEPCFSLPQPLSALAPLPGHLGVARWQGAAECSGETLMSYSLLLQGV